MELMIFLDVERQYRKRTPLKKRHLPAAVFFSNRSKSAKLPSRFKRAKISSVELLSSMDIFLVKIFTKRLASYILQDKSQRTKCRGLREELVGGTHPFYFFVSRETCACDLWPVTSTCGLWCVLVGGTHPYFLFMLEGWWNTTSPLVPCQEFFTLANVGLRQQPAIVNEII